MKEKKRKKTVPQPSLFAQKPTPETAGELVNNYGTYNIQPTADSENLYPAIAQGYHEKIAKNREMEKRRNET